jgi:hypothetical protein
MTLTDSTSPTLTLLHSNVKNTMNISICSVDFVFNLVAIKNIIQFADYSLTGMNAIRSNFNSMKLLINLIINF